MKTNKNINIVMTMAAAVVLVAVNVGVWMAAGKGTIAPIDNPVMWGAFVVLNVVSILWAISLLGLQPLVVSLSYVVGGFLAFKGVRGMEGINVAEVATAGATYGAFGALAVGNATVKVRLAFFNKGQVPFIFILIGLLVLDGVLNSQISKADGGVFVNAVLFPLVASGSIGAIWSILNRFGVGKKPSEKIAEAEAAVEETAGKKVEAATSGKLVIPMPEHALDADDEAEPAIAAQEEGIAPAPEAQPTVAEEPAGTAVAQEQKPEEFFPLEIDKGEEFEMPEADDSLLEVISMMEDGEKEDDSFSVTSFDAGLYASGSLDDEGGVMVEEPTVSVALDLDAEPEASHSEEAPAEPEAKQEAQPEPEPAQEKPSPEEPKQEKKDDDWLGGHLDLLNKLK